jgi:hypothetical protein
MFSFTHLFAQEDVPIVEAEHLGSGLAVVRINTPELDSVVVEFADLFLDSLEDARGILLDVRTLWFDAGSVDSLQRLMFTTIVDCVGTKPLVVQSLRRVQTAPVISELVRSRLSTDTEFSNDPLAARRRLKETVSLYETGGQKTVEEMDKLREEYERLRDSLARDSTRIPGK